MSAVNKKGPINGISLHHSLKFPTHIGKTKSSSFNSYLGVESYHQMTQVTTKHNQQYAFTTIHNPADLSFFSLIGSTLHVGNKTNHQSAFNITPIWEQKI